MPSEDDIQHQHNLLRIYRRNAQQLTRQVTTYGPVDVPIHMVSNLRSQLNNIARIKHILANWGADVEDMEVDEFDLSEYE